MYLTAWFSSTDLKLHIMRKLMLIKTRITFFFNMYILLQSKGHQSQL